MRLIALVLVSFAIAFSSFAAEEVRTFDSEEQRFLFIVLTEELRCPKCQNQNVADSNATVAKDMRDKIYQLVKQGYTKSEVVDYMKERYGDFVHYQPPMKASTLILWFGPVIFLVLAILVIWRQTKLKPTAQSQVNLDAEVDALLKDNNEANK